MLRMNSKLLIVCCSLLLAAGCAATTPVQRQVAPLPEMPTLEGSYHRVRKGETLWRIARAYGLEIDHPLPFRKRMVVGRPSTRRARHVAVTSMVNAPGKPSAKEKIGCRKEKLRFHLLWSAHSSTRIGATRV